MISFTAMLKRLLFVSIMLIGLASCKSYDNIRYLKNINEVELTSENNDYQNKIVPDDVLRITVTAADPNSVAPFNLPLASFMPIEGSMISSSPSTLQNYLVNQNGDISFPVLGEIKVSGMTRIELAEYLEEKISRYAKNPIVTVNIVNFRFTILGEVNKPGVKILLNDKTTILEAIGLAEDLTLYGMRDEVLLIRDIDGKKNIYKLDLGDASLINSDAYYIKQNDVIYIKPNKYKQKNARYSQRDSYEISVFSAIISTASVIASLLIALLVK